MALPPKCGLCEPVDGEYLATFCLSTVKKLFFSFPGGRRFYFADTNDNEYAVCSGQNDFRELSGTLLLLRGSLIDEKEKENRGGINTSSLPRTPTSRTAELKVM